MKRKFKLIITIICILVLLVLVVDIFNDKPKNRKYNEVEKSSGLDTNSNDEHLLTDDDTTLADTPVQSEITIKPEQTILPYKTDYISENNFINVITDILMGVQDARKLLANNSVYNNDIDVFNLVQPIMSGCNFGKGIYTARVETPRGYKIYKVKFKLDDFRLISSFRYKLIKSNESSNNDVGTDSIVKSEDKPYDVYVEAITEMFYGTVSDDLPIEKKFYITLGNNLIYNKVLDWVELLSYDKDKNVMVFDSNDGKLTVRFGLNAENKICSVSVN